MNLAECALLLRDGDDVAVTTRDLAAGTRFGKIAPRFAIGAGAGGRTGRGSRRC